MAAALQTAIAPARHLPEAACCSVIGARHRREGKVCQDSVRKVRVDGAVALALADGHGTSARGEIGAALAVDVAVEQLRAFAASLGANESADRRVVHAYAEHPLRVQMVRRWTERVREHAAAEDVDLHAYGTTLLFALTTPSYVLVGQLGDGDILMVGPDGAVQRPIPPDPRHFAEETSSLCQPAAWSAMVVRTVPPPEGESLLVLSTDGYSKSYETDAVFELIGPDYLEMMREYGVAGVEAQLPEILGAVTAGGSGDDIAMGLLHWTAHPSRKDGNDGEA